MGEFDYRLSRVSALRPRSAVPGVRPGAVTGSNSERLMETLGGEIRTTLLGVHLRVQARFPEPAATGAEFQALRLIAPHSGDPVCDPAQWLFLDTETTGLSGGTGTYAFLVGLGWWEEGKFVVEQVFMRNHAEEPSLLLDVLERLGQRRVLVTFNGKSFDWPLLVTRFQMTRTGPAPEPLAHLDLLHPARQIWRLSLKSVALTSLERHVLGFHRGSDIPSETIPQRYFEFLRGGPSEPMVEVFRHNQMDIRGLAVLALRIAGLLADPAAPGCGAGELFGISRLLQRRGHASLAGQMYRKALEEGLPESAEPVACRELATLAKRSSDFELANSLWNRLLGDSREGWKAYEQLAIYYEHRASQPREAESLSREALVKLQESFRAGRVSTRRYRQLHASFQHRLKRLSSKISG